MLYNTTQAAHILGCTIGTVAKLVKTGKLQAEPRSQGPKRGGHLYFKPMVVKEFKKTYHNRINGKPKPIKMLVNVPNPEGIQTRLINLETKVSGMEEKIDYLVKLWS